MLDTRELTGQRSDAWTIRGLGCVFRRLSPSSPPFEYHFLHVRVHSNTLNKQISIFRPYFSLSLFCADKRYFVATIDYETMPVCTAFVTFFFRQTGSVSFY